MRDPEDFRKSRILAAVANQKNHMAEVKELKENLAKLECKWKVINSNKSQDKMPTVLSVAGEIVTSQQKIANTLADHFKSKIKVVTDSLDADEEKAMFILKSLIEPNKASFEF